jgi:hypothetical protein
MIKEEEKGLVPCGIPFIFPRVKMWIKQMGRAIRCRRGEVLIDRATSVDLKAKTLKTEAGLNSVLTSLFLPPVQAHCYKPLSKAMT